MDFGKPFFIPEALSHEDKEDGIRILPQNCIKTQGALGLCFYTLYLFGV
jgi:hypothetical protein